MSMSAPFILSSSQPVSFSKRIAWITLTVVMAMLLRIPLWIHGTDSLDSDAACNGLMLKWMSEGQGGWHLPGIHYMGVTEIILALPAAWCFGVNTYTLISGPVIAFGLYVGATYGLVNLLYGHQTAIRALLATVFISPDILFWSNFPIGGHVLITFWHMITIILLIGYFKTNRKSQLFVFGVWLGLGFYTYHMYLFTIAMIVPVMLLQAVMLRSQSVFLLRTFLCATGFLLGWSPHWCGIWLQEPDVYGTQIQFTIPANMNKLSLLTMQAEHNLDVFITECLPKFLTGYRVDAWWQNAYLSMLTLGVVLIWIMVVLVFYGMIIRSWCCKPAEGNQIFALRSGRFLMALTPLVTLMGFLIHPAVNNEFNSRYLIYIMSWWPLAFAVVVTQLASCRRWMGTALMTALVVVYSGLLFQWNKNHDWPIQKESQKLVMYLKQQEEFQYLLGDYWDVYRFSFLTNEHIRGVPIQMGSVYMAHVRYTGSIRVESYRKESIEAKSVGILLRRELQLQAPPHSELRFQDEQYELYVLHDQSANRWHVPDPAQSILSRP